MFFEEGNCRALRLLHEASNFLEVSLEKLLVLEQEAISELNRSKTDATSGSCNLNNTSLNANEVDNMTLKFVPNDTISRDTNIASVCSCTSESRNHNCFCLNIKLSPVERQLLPNIPENSSKRNYEAIQVNEDNAVVLKKHADKNKRTKKENTNQHSSDGHGQNMTIKDEFVNPIEHNTFTSIGNISNNSCGHENIVSQCSKKGEASELKTVTVLEEYFKVCIKFKESFPYGTVEELIKSVGLDDVFDIVLTKKKAEVTFLNENSMKKALNLSPAALKKLKASSILLVKK